MVLQLLGILRNQVYPSSKRLALCKTSCGRRDYNRSGHNTLTICLPLPPLKALMLIIATCTENLCKSQSLCCCKSVSIVASFPRLFKAWFCSSLPLWGPYKSPSLLVVEMHGWHLHWSLAKYSFGISGCWRIFRGDAIFCDC